MIFSADLLGALEVVRPTAMAESTLDIPDLTLDDVGDMTQVKQALTETVLWPLSYPDTFARLGVQPARGVLLYGPPGCGKTYLVRAIAGSGQANVLSVKGAELLSKWVGESERAVRELFRRAREAAPALVFLDEVDALAPVRGQSSDSGVGDRVVAALLTELDGIEGLSNVVVVGATNRPDLVDPALLRPGRMERLVFVPPPDAAARAAILRATAKKTPLGRASTWTRSRRTDRLLRGADWPRWSARRRSARCAAPWRAGSDGRGHGRGPARRPPVARPGPGRRARRFRLPACPDVTAVSPRPAAPAPTPLPQRRRLPIPQPEPPELLVRSPHGDLQRPREDRDREPGVVSAARTTAAPRRSTSAVTSTRSRA